MAESRGLLIESLAKGYQSTGFQLYAKLAGAALGEQGDAYRCYLLSVFDEFALDLPVLFDRFSRECRLFPREAALLELLGHANHLDIMALWAEDETIGWIYQYFNTDDDRQRARYTPQGKPKPPQNSRDLAVRNQFFTPRYIVEFLTDNTLGRIWYEMTTGQTTLVETCRYMMRRPIEVFLRSPSAAEMPEWLAAAYRGDFTQLPDNPLWREIEQLALAIDGDRLCRQLGSGESGDLAPMAGARHVGEGPSSGRSDQLWLTLFLEQRRLDQLGQDPKGKDWETIQSLYHALRAALAADYNDPPQDQLLKQPSYLPFRQLKDPRGIKILDPACGSMHFGLYAFDLIERIYSEAWDLESTLGSDVFARPEGLKPLQRSYECRDAFLREVPRLVIENNVHGIDIDHRAVQIAGLSLWLRAHKSWHDQGVAAADRPRVRRANVVCAEPMPGERNMLGEFSDTLRPPVLGQLVKVVFEKMKLAGEAGSLLRIDEDLRDSVVEAKRQWLARPKTEQMILSGCAPRVILEKRWRRIKGMQFLRHTEHPVYWTPRCHMAPPYVQRFRTESIPSRLRVRGQGTCSLPETQCPPLCFAGSSR
jgi:hypothetical protein